MPLVKNVDVGGDAPADAALLGSVLNKYELGPNYPPAIGLEIPGALNLKPIVAVTVAPVA